MADTRTSQLGILKPEDNKTNWGDDYGERFADIVDAVLSNVIRGNMILSGGVVSAGAGALTVDTTAGYARIGGTVRNWGAGDENALTDDDDNYVYINSSGTLTVSITVPTGNFTFLAYVPCASGARVGIYSTINNMLEDYLDNNGRLLHEFGGMEADVNAYDGIPQIKSGATGEIAQGAGLASHNYVRNGCGTVCTGTVPDGWTVAGGATVTQQTGVGYGERGSACIKVLSDADGSCVLQTIIPINGINTSANTFLRSRVFTLSGRVNASDASNARIQFSDNVAAAETSYHSGTPGWETLKITFTTNVAAEALLVRLVCDGNTKTAYFTDIKLEEGPHASAYSPHPNDEHLKATQYMTVTDGAEVDYGYGLIRAEMIMVQEATATIANITFQQAFTKVLGCTLADWAGNNLNVHFTNITTSAVDIVFEADLGAANYAFVVAWGVA